MQVYLLSCYLLSDSVTPWTVAHQAPLSIGFPRKEYWSGLSFPSQGDLPDPGIKPVFPALQADFFTVELPGKPGISIYILLLLLLLLSRFSRFQLCVTP